MEHMFKKPRMMSETFLLVLSLEFIYLLKGVTDEES